MNEKLQSKSTIVAVRDFIFRFNDRLKTKDGEFADSADILLNVEDARLFYAAWKWMEFIEIRGSGVELTRIPFRDCVPFIKAKAESLKAGGDGDRSINLNRYGINVMMAVEKHIDQLAMAEDVAGSGKKKGKRKQ